MTILAPKRLDTGSRSLRAQAARATASLRALRILLNCAFHPNAPGGAEIEAIEPAKFHVRTDEYELFGTTQWKEWLHSRPYALTGMSELRDAWRAPNS